MAEADCTRIAITPTLPLATKVAVGIVDVSAVGARVLLSLQPAVGWTVVETPLQLKGLQGTGLGNLEGPRPVLSAPVGVQLVDGPAASGNAAGVDGPAPSSSHTPAVLVRNFYAPGSAPGEAGLSHQTPGTCRPQVSLLILNTLVTEGEQAEVAAALLDFLQESRGVASGGEAAGPGPGSAAQQEPPPDGPDGASSGAAAEGSAAEATSQEAEAGGAVYVAAALLLQHLAQPAALYQHLLNAAPPLSSSTPPALPTAASAGAAAASATASAAAAASGAIRVRDGQLAALLHVLEVSGTPACCLLAPGHKPPATTPLDLPNSVSACDTLGAALAAELGLQYDSGQCRAVRALYKWFVPEKLAGSDVMYM